MQFGDLYFSQFSTFSSVNNKLINKKRNLRNIRFTKQMYLTANDDGNDERMVVVLFPMLSEEVGGVTGIVIQVLPHS